MLSVSWSEWDIPESWSPVNIIYIERMIHMKNFRRILAVLLVVAMMAVFAGCGKMTPEKLAGKMALALTKTPMSSETVEMGFEMALGSQGFTMDMAMDISMDMVVALEPYRAYSDMTISMDMMGQNMTETSQVYMLEENGTVTTYTYVESAGIWQKATVDISAAEMTSNSSYNWLAQKPAEELTLDEETQTINGKEVYVLRCTISGTQMQDVMSSMGGMNDALSDMGLSDMDMSALNVPAVFYIDAKTFLPVQIDMEIQGMDEMMKDAMEQTLGGDLASMGVELEIGSVRMACTNISYEAAEVPEVPQEAIDTAIEIQE